MNLWIMQARIRFQNLLFRADGRINRIQILSGRYNLNADIVSVYGKLLLTELLFIGPE